MFLKKRRETEKAIYKEQKKNPDFLRTKRETLRRSRYRKKNDLPAEEISDLGGFKARSSLSKAIKKVSKSLPKDKDRKQTVVKKLYYDHFPSEKPKADRLIAPSKDVDKLVKDFYLRDDVSQQLAGIKDTKVIRETDGSKSYVQKRVLLMTLGEAHAVFLKTHPQFLVGRTKFCLMKPNHVELVSQLKQAGCLCKKCENMKLLFTALKPKMIDTIKDSIDSLEAMLNSMSCGELCNSTVCDVCCGNAETFIGELFEGDELDDEITITQWAQDVYQLKLKSEIKDLASCIKDFTDRFIDYKHHIFVKKSQSSLFYQARESSTIETAVIQVDFAENFKCISQNEVQSAYFNQHAIAIFTVVIWAGQKTFSKVLVTDDTSHSKYCVLAFMHEIFSDLKKDLPGLKAVKIFSDGCAGQFKNRWTLSLVLTANFLFGIDLSWNFFASGHGKGAVDGVGGTVKRSVYQRIMTGLVRVYSAQEFHDCLDKNVHGISSIFVPVDEIKTLETVLADKWKHIKAIPNVTQFFCFNKDNDKTIETREVGSSVTTKKFQIIP